MISRLTRFVWESPLFLSGPLWEDSKTGKGKVFWRRSTATRKAKSRVFPLLSISYNHYLKNWFSLNTRLSYSGRYNYIYTGADSYVDHLEINPVINIMEVAQFTYMRKEKVRLYSGVGLGISTLYGSLIPAIQFTFFGASFGKKVFGFVETGGGTEYFSVHGGIGYRF